VKEPPIANDTIQLIGEDGKTFSACKLLLEISVRELHNDMIKPVSEGGLEGAIDDDGKQIVSDTMLRSLLPKNMRRMTERHKMMCSCEVCITPKRLQLTLNSWRQRFLKQMDRDGNELEKGHMKTMYFQMDYRGMRHCVMQ